MDGHGGGTPEGAYGDGGRYCQDGAYGDGGPTGVPYNPVYPPAYGMAPSSSLQPSRLDLGRLDLNSTSEWEDSQGPPPVRVPARSGRGTLGLTLRDGLPDYVDEMDKMFTGFVADGSTLYAPEQRTVHHIPSDDDEDEEAEEADDQDVGTPVSVGSKRSTSSRSTTSVCSTASSPHKKLRSPAVRAMCEKIGGLTAAIGDSRVFFNDAISQRAALKEAAQQAALRAAKEAAEQKRKEDEAQMDRVIELAKECGFTEESPEWIGVLNILNNEKATAWFLKNGIPGRITTIKNYAYRV